MKLNINFNVDVEVEFEWEPAQYGGRTDPSWDAYAMLTNVWLDNGKTRTDIFDYLSEEDITAIEDQIVAHQNEEIGGGEPDDYEPSDAEYDGAAADYFNRR